MADEEHEVLTWEGFGVAARELAHAVHVDGFGPDLILSIARGGLFVAGALGYALDVKNLHVMNVEYYTGVDERLPLPVVLPPVPAPVDLSGAHVLVADDVADTGATLALVKDFCAEHVAEVRCAVVYEKPASVVRCEYVWATTDRWIDFPWSTNRQWQVQAGNPGRMGCVGDNPSSGIVAIAAVLLLALILRWVFKPSQPRQGRRPVDASESPNLGLLTVVVSGLDRQDAMMRRATLGEAQIRSSMSKRRDGLLDVLVFHADADRARLLLDS